jgi:hypothetical protein
MEISYISLLLFVYNTLLSQVEKIDQQRYVLLNIHSHVVGCNFIVILLLFYMLFQIQGET